MNRLSINTGIFVLIARNARVIEATHLGAKA